MDPSRAADEAARELANLRGQADEARAALADLQADLRDAEARLHGHEAYRLLEVNEQLVVSMLRAQAEAETSAAALKELSRLAEFDALTGLPNRALLHDRFTQAAAHARRHDGRMALLFIDLDGFKAVNDDLGHAAGDGVLCAVATRLAACVRGADTVSRYGGDEFVVLLTEVPNADDAARIAGKLLAALAEPLGMGERELRIGASIGIAIFPDDAVTADELIALADDAMYRAKVLGAPAYAGRGLATAGAPAGGSQPRRGNQPLRTDDLREMNEGLVLAALSAAELQEAAERTLARHVDFLAVIGHELRAPLSPIRTAAAVLGKGPLEDATLMRLKVMLERQVAHIARLVDDLVETSHVKRGRLSVQRTAVDLVPLLQQAIDVCRPAIDGRAQSLRFHVTPGMQIVSGDAMRLVQVCTNLVDNASKYTPARGLITVSCVADGHDFVLTVADEGIGIAPGVLHTIFEPFTRAPEAVGFGPAGLGIGLTVVRELIQAHGGTVAAFSDGPNRGSRFVVRLAAAA